MSERKSSESFLICPIPDKNFIIRYDPADTLNDLADSLPDLHFFCAHTGKSMNPTLDQMDLLELVRYDGLKPRTGDVILFLPPQGDKAVVHRIIQVTNAGLCTRGDNNPSVDPWLVQPSDVIGWVVAAQRGGKRRLISGGRLGFITTWLVRKWNFLKVLASRILYPFYDSLALSGIIQLLVPVYGKTKIVAFRVGKELQLRLLWRQRIVGSYNQQTSDWYITPPYRLLINNRSLPR